jgi:hypothetical protein
MPLPPLNANGFLPPGIHDTTLDEVRERFGTFQGSDRRGQLIVRLQQLIAALRLSKQFIAVIVDGSFVTAKPKPEDIDLVIVLHHDHDWRGDLGPSEYALVNRPALRRNFGFDALLAAEGGADYERYIEFFGRVRDDASVRKGIVRIRL